MIENLCLLVEFWLMKYLKLEMDQHFADELKFKISLHCCYHAVLLPLFTYQIVFQFFCFFINP